MYTRGDSRETVDVDTPITHTRMDIYRKVLAYLPVYLLTCLHGYLIGGTWLYLLSKSVPRSVQSRQSRHSGTGKKEGLICR